MLIRISFAVVVVAISSSDFFLREDSGTAVTCAFSKDFVRAQFPIGTCFAF